MDTYWTPIFNSQTLGERIRKARMDKGLRAKDLAKMLGVSEDSVLNWEKDKNKPTGKNLEKVKEFLNGYLYSSSTKI